MTIPMNPDEVQEQRDLHAFAAADDAAAPDVPVAIEGSVAMATMRPPTDAYRLVLAVVGPEGGLIQVESVLTGLAISQLDSPTSWERIFRPLVVGLNMKLSGWV